MFEGVLIVLMGFGVIMWLIMMSRARAASEADEMEAEIKDLREKVMVVTSATIPGREIREVLGTVTGISKEGAYTDDGFRLAEKQAMLEAMRQAFRLGADAVIDLKITSASYQQNGSQWMMAKVSCYGTAVRTESA